MAEREAQKKAKERKRKKKRGPLSSPAYTVSLNLFILSCFRPAVLISSCSILPSRFLAIVPIPRRFPFSSFHSSSSSSNDSARVVSVSVDCSIGCIFDTA